MRARTCVCVCVCVPVCLSVCVWGMCLLFCGCTCVRVGARDREMIRAFKIIVNCFIELH